MEIAKKLKMLLRAKEMHVSQLARATKVPRQTLDNWLSGQEPRSIKQVKTIANYFEISVDELCFGQKVKPKANEDVIERFEDEINAGVFEVILRKIKSSKL